MEKKLLLSFPPEATFQSFAYELVKDYDLRINILKAEIEIGKGGKLLMAIEAPEENIERGKMDLEHEFRRNGIIPEPEMLAEIAQRLYEVAWYSGQLAG